MTNEALEDLANSLSSKWNYRVMLMDESYPDEPWYEIHEVFYNKKGKPALWGSEVQKANGESKKDVIHGLLLMALDANRHPVLKESDMPKGAEDGTNNREGRKS